MKYELFAEEIKRGVEELVKDKLGDGIVVIRNVRKNNNVRMKAVSIMRKGEKATPTIYIRDYYEDYKNGRDIGNICDEIFQIYIDGISRFNNNIKPEEFEEFEKIEDNIYYRLVNYEMNEALLKNIPHFKFLDLAIVFYILVDCYEGGQAMALVYNQHLDNWGKTTDEVKEKAFNNTWSKYPPVIKKMEDIVSELIIGDIIGDFEDSEDVDNVREDIVYDGYNYDQLESIIREEVEKLKSSKDMEMYVLTNDIRLNGATCITYPNVLKEFAKEHKSDIYIIPSSIHEVILIVGTEWEKEVIDKMIVEVNKKEVDPVDVLSEHVYIFDKDNEEIRY